MEGVTTAIVSFIFLGAALPRLIKNRPQYYMCLGIVVVILLLDALARVGSGSEGLGKFCYLFSAIAQMVAVVLLVLCSGGLTVGEFKAEIGNAIEVVRRGESEKEVIIPLSDAAKKIKADADYNRAVGRRTATTDDSPQVFHIDSPPAADSSTPRPDPGPLPLD